MGGELIDSGMKTWPLVSDTNGANYSMAAMTLTRAGRGLATTTG
jgi:hypothetical protein